MAFSWLFGENLYGKRSQLLAFKQNFKTVSGKKKVKLAELAYL
jgi:hypothetical protein